MPLLRSTSTRLEAIYSITKTVSVSFSSDSDLAALPMCLMVSLGLFVDCLLVRIGRTDGHFLRGEYSTCSFSVLAPPGGWLESSKCSHMNHVWECGCMLPIDPTLRGNTHCISDLDEHGSTPPTTCALRLAFARSGAARLFCSYNRLYVIDSEQAAECWSVSHRKIGKPGT